MIIERIVLENWKQIDALDIELDRGVNLIHGPNEIGKSTLVQALNYALLKESSSNKKELREIIKWGTETQAKIKLFFKLKDEDYLIEKSFPKGETHLHISKGDQLIKLSEGKTADKKILELLTINETGLLDVFWSSQNSLSNYEYLLNTDTKMSVRESIQKNLIHPESETFFQRIVSTEGYGRFFTPAGKIKKGSGLPEKQEILSKCYDEKESIDLHLASIEELNDKKVGYSKELSQIERDIHKHKKSRDELDKKRTQFNEKKHKYDLAQKDFLVVETQFRSLKKQKDKYLQHVREIKDYETKLGGGEGQVVELKTLMDKENTQLNDLETREQRLIIELNKLEKEIQDNKGKIGYVEKMLDIYIYKKDLEEAEEKKKDIDQIDGEIETLTAKIHEIKIPDKRTIEKAGKVFDQIEREKAALEALQLKVTIIPKDDMNIKIKKDNLENYSHTLTIGEETELMADGEMSIDFVDHALVQIKSGKGDLKEKRARIVSLQGEYDSLLGKSEEKKTHILLDQNELKEELINDVNLIKERKKAKLDKYINTDGLTTFIDSLNDSIRQAIEELNQGKLIIDIEISKESLSLLKEKTDEKEMKLTELRKNTYSKLNEEKEQQNKKLSKINVDKGSFESEIRQFKEAIAKNNNEIKDILADKTEGEIEDELKVYQEKYDGLKKRCDDLKVDPKDEIREEDIQELETALEELISEQDQVKENKNKEVGALNILRNEDHKESLLKKETEIQRIEAELKQLRTEASAYNLLKTLMEEEKQSYTSNIVEPLAQKFLDNINSLKPSTSFNRMNLTGDYKLENFNIQTVSGEEKAIDTQSLSLGMREQLALIYKLTISEFMASNTIKFPIILDDPLATTDPQRMNVMMNMINNLASKYQFILLTCNPDNYLNGRWNAKKIDLSMR